MIVQKMTWCSVLWWGLLAGMLLPWVARSGSVQELTLAEAIEMALAGNPELAALGYDENAAAARSETAFARRLPRLDFVASGMYHMHDQRLLPASENGQQGAFSDQLLAGDVVISLPLYTGGLLSREQRASDLLRSAAANELSRSREELIYNVSSVFYRILAQNRVIVSLEFSQEALREHMKQVLEMIKVQKAAAVDRLRIEVRVADLEQRLVSENNILAVQTRVLSNLLGRPEEAALLKPAGTLAELPDPGLQSAGSLADSLNARADYQAALASLSARREALAAARAGHLPTVSLQGSYGRRWAVDSPDRSQGHDSNRETGWVGILLQVPVFSGGQVQARVREENALLEAARERLRKLELQIRLELEIASLNIQAARERLEALTKAGEQAAESLRIEREKYELGKGSITDVLDAQTALLDTQTNYCRAMADYHTALAQLKLAKGK